MDRQSQQLDKILAVHNQSRDEHQGTGERSFYRTAKKDELTLVPKKEFQTLDKPREGAISAMLVTEHSADVYARPDAQQLASRVAKLGANQGSNANGAAQRPQESAGAASKDTGELQKTAPKKVFKRSRFFSAKHPVNRQAARTSFIFRPDVSPNLVDHQRQDDFNKTDAWQLRNQVKGRNQPQFSSTLNPEGTGNAARMG